MNITKYSNLFDFDIQDNLIIYDDPFTGENYKVDISGTRNVKICNIFAQDRLLATIGDKYLIYVKDNEVWIKSQQIDNELYDVSIKRLNNNNDLKINFENGYIANIKLGEELLFVLKDFFVHEIDEKIIVKKLEYRNQLKYNERQRYIGIANINFNNIKIFITYDRLLSEIKMKKMPYKLESINDSLKIELINANNLKVENLQTDDLEYININKVGLNPSPLKNIRMSNKLKNDHILAYFTISNKRYFIFNQSNGIHILRSNPKQMTQFRTYLKKFTSKKAFYLFGLYKHNGYKAKHRYDTLYLQNKNYEIGKLTRPFKKFKILNQFVIGKIPFENIIETNRIHSNLMCGNEKYVLHNVSFNGHAKPMKTHKTKHHKNNTLILRNNLGGNITLTSIPASKEYKINNKIKIRVARLLNKFTFKKKINLFFEKKSERAEESAIRVFEEALKSSKKDNYFILDKNASYFKELKKKYGKYLVKKYSLKHYHLIYKSSHFISSELPNHLVNDRLYIDSLRKK